jgi:beta-lactam-binding protein with PASTA domain
MVGGTPQVEGQESSSKAARVAGQSPEPGQPLVEGGVVKIKVGPS